MVNDIPITKMWSNIQFVHLVQYANFVVGFEYKSTYLSKFSHDQANIILNMHVSSFLHSRV